MGVGLKTAWERAERGCAQESSASIQRGGCELVATEVWNYR
jgi:hypothetical protein